jgi:hypothetical protein
MTGTGKTAEGQVCHAAIRFHGYRWPLRARRSRRPGQVEPVTLSGALMLRLRRAARAAGGVLTDNYAAFLAVGLVFNTLLEASLTGPFTSLSQNYWSARLETILHSPCPVHHAAPH